MTVDTTLTGKAEAGLFFPPVSSSTRLSKLKSTEIGEMWSSQPQGEEKRKKERNLQRVLLHYKYTVTQSWAEVILKHLVEKPAKIPSEAIICHLWLYLPALTLNTVRSWAEAAVNFRALCVIMCPCFTSWMSGQKHCCWDLGRQLKMRSLFVELKSPVLVFSINGPC